MQTFKEYIFESVEIVDSKWFDSEIPISIKPKSLGKAIVDLHQVRHLSHATTSNTQNQYRGMFDIRTGKFYIWYAEDAMHGDVASIFNLTDPIRILYDSKTRNARLIQDFKPAEIENRHDLFVKFFGKNTKIRNDLKPMKWA